MSSRGRIDHLTQNVSNIRINHEENGGYSENDSWRNKNRGGRQWGPQVPIPKAQGRPYSAQKFDIRGGASGSGMIPRQNYNGHGRGRGRVQGGWPQAMATPRVVSPRRPTWVARVKQNDIKEEYFTPNIFDDEEENNIDDDDDDDSDDNDDDEELSKSHKKLKRFFKDLDTLSFDEINNPTRQWHCPVCKGIKGGMDWYKGIQPLITHAGTKMIRGKLHRGFMQLLKDEIQMRKASNSFGEGSLYEGLTKEKKDYTILWPPMVMIMNTKHEKGDNDKWIGMGNDELLEHFSSYSLKTAKNSYGPEGHRGFGLLVFESSAMGYMDALELHEHFLEEGRGRKAWNEKYTIFSSERKHKLFGWLATKDDVDWHNLHLRERESMKFELVSHREKVVSEMRQMRDDNQQLSYYKNKVIATERQLKALSDSTIHLSDKLRVTSEQNRILKHWTKMHHEQHQEQMDFQDTFLKERIAEILESVNTKEDKL